MKPLQSTFSKYTKQVTKKINLKKRINCSKRHLRIKKNRRRLLYIAGSFVIYSLVMGLIAQHTQADHTKYMLNQRLSSQHKAVLKLTGQLQTVQKEKATTDQEVQQKAADEANLKAQIDNLNQQLQAKAAAKAQSLAAAAARAATFTAQAAAAPAPVYQAPVAVSSGCVSGYASGDYYLDKIISFESGVNSSATNGGGCFGLLQACPGSPLRAACGGNPTCQIEWFQANKTGGRSWAQVWQHELAYGWW